MKIFSFAKASEDFIPAKPCAKAARRSRIVTVSGAHSGAGKTFLIEALLKKLKGWSCVKVTTSHNGPCPKERPCGACDDLESKFCITSDEKLMNEDGKDTARFKAAGAKKVLWLRAKPEGLKRGLAKAVRLLKGARGILIEGTSVLKYLKPDLAILVMNKGSVLKPSAVKVLDKIDLVVEK